jgi:hypothetical protein
MSTPEQESTLSGESTLSEQSTLSEEHVPPTGEEIHLPGSSLLPLLLAIGITLTLVGITLGIELTVIGLVLSIPVLVVWIRSTREDIEELPPGH